jgi:hypothetical protein
MLPPRIGYWLYFNAGPLLVHCLPLEWNMRQASRLIGAFARAGLLFSLMTVAGCGHQNSTVYDANHRDYHKWDDREEAAYRRWEAENHKPHQDYANRPPQEQNDYWNWRHSHPDPH